MLGRAGSRPPHSRSGLRPGRKSSCRADQPAGGLSEAVSPVRRRTRLLGATGQESPIRLSRGGGRRSPFPDGRSPVRLPGVGRRSPFPDGPTEALRATRWVGIGCPRYPIIVPRSWRGKPGRRKLCWAAICVAFSAAGHTYRRKSGPVCQSGAADLAPRVRRNCGPWTARERGVI